MRPTDNRPSNLELLCPTCHAIKHKEKVKTVVGYTIFGEKRQRVSKRKPKKVKSRKKVRPRKAKSGIPGIGTGKLPGVGW